MGTAGWLMIVALGAVAAGVLWNQRRTTTAGPSVLAQFDAALDRRDQGQIVALERAALETPEAVMNHEVRAVILGQVGRAYLTLGNATEGRPRLDEALQLTSDPTLWLDFAPFAAMCAQRLGDIRRARYLYEQQILRYERGDRSGDPFNFWAGAHLLLGTLDLKSGDRAGYEHHVAGARAAVDGSRDRRASLVVLGDELEVAIHAGDFERARRVAAELPGDPFDPRWEAGWLRSQLLVLLAELAARDGDQVAADRAIDAARSAAAEPALEPNEPPLVHGLGRVAWARADGEGARRHLVQARAGYDARERYNAAAQVATDLADAAADFGWPDRAALVADAIARNERMGYTAVAARLRAAPG